MNMFFRHEELSALYSGHNGMNFVADLLPLNDILYTLDACQDICDTSRAHFNP